MAYSIARARCANPIGNSSSYLAKSTLERNVLIDIGHNTPEIEWIVCNGSGGVDDDDNDL